MIFIIKKESAVKKLTVLFFVLALLVEAQENVVVLPPLVVSQRAVPPPKEFQKILIEFRNHYQKELRRILIGKETLDHWWILVILMPDEKKHWCIKVIATKEEKRAKPLKIIQITIPAEKTSFDSAVEAKRAAKETNKILRGIINIVRRASNGARLFYCCHYIIVIQVTTIPPRLVYFLVKNLKLIYFYI